MSDSNKKTTPPEESFNAIIREPLFGGSDVVEASQSDPGVVSQLDFEKCALEDAEIEAQRAADNNNSQTSVSFAQDHDAAVAASQPDDVVEEAVAAAQPPAKSNTRKRFNYAKEFFYAPPCLHLKPSALHTLDELPKACVIGKVQHCPRKERGHIVDWPNHGDPLPLPIDNFATEFANNPEVKNKPMDCILKHKELGLQPPTKKRAAAKKPSPSKQQQQNPSSSAPATTTPSQIIAHQAGAAFHASSSISTMSAGSSATLSTRRSKRSATSETAPTTDSSPPDIEEAQQALFFRL